MAFDADEGRSEWLEELFETQEREADCAWPDESMWITYVSRLSMYICWVHHLCKACGVVYLVHVTMLVLDKDMHLLICDKLVYSDMQLIGLLYSIN